MKFRVSEVVLELVAHIVAIVRVPIQMVVTLLQDDAFVRQDGKV